MEHRYSIVAREGHVTIVTLNRPERMNALDHEAHREFAGVFDDFEADPDQWVAIVTGQGERAFCAGKDLKATAASGYNLNERVESGFAGLTHRLGRNKPVIAAVNGIALGGGFELALACDLIIAAENAVFALPEPRVGLAALGGGLLRLPRQIGEKQALGIILTGRHVSAQEGQALGFVNEVVAPGQALDAARRWAAQICEASPMAIRAAKEVVRLSDDRPLAQALEDSLRSPAVLAMLASEDVKEGPRAFAEKRKPKWKGT
ncbi:MAG: enoyl-CoA hydratase [Rhodospirillaceae bacterium]|nr:MAG: enoyl-CoA hydratase [Rhodospirillaceae bacterium]